MPGGGSAMRATLARARHRGELPEIYQREEQFIPKGDEEMKLEGRGQSKRADVNHDDAFDDPFLAVSSSSLSPWCAQLAQELGEEHFDEPRSRGRRGRPSKLGLSISTLQPDPCAYSLSQPASSAHHTHVQAENGNVLQRRPRSLLPSTTTTTTIYGRMYELHLNRSEYPLNA